MITFTAKDCIQVNPKCPKNTIVKNTSESIRSDEPMVPQGAGTHEHDQNDGATKCNLDIHLPSQRYNIQMPHHAGDANYVAPLDK